MLEAIQTFSYKNFECDIYRDSKFKYYTGYILIPKGHYLFGMNHREIDDVPIYIHGGWTFSERMGPDWYIGFDCSHYNDFQIIDGQYTHIPNKDITFVQEQLKQAIDQLILMANGTL